MEPGQFARSDGTVAGRYVSFAVDEQLGTVRGYTVAGTTFFSQVKAPGPWELTIDGPYVDLVGDNFSMHVVDAPSGPFRLATTGYWFTLNWPQEVDFAYRDGNFHLAADGREAFLTGARQNYEGMLIDSQSIFKVRASSVGDVASFGYAFQDDIDDAIEQGLVAAHIQVFDDTVQYLTYEPVQLDTRKFHNESYRVVLDAELDSGRAFIVDFPTGVFQEQIDIEFYDESLGALVPAAITLADGLADALQAQAGESAEYWWAVEPGGLRLIVSVPSFSVHAFDVLGVPPEFVPMIVYGLAAGAFFAAIATVAMFLKPRRD
jgi:hypothetical protein